MTRHLQSLALGAAVVAVIPYAVLKVLWLAGSEVGMRNAATIAEGESTRMVVGNAITVVLELLAVALAFALTRPWGQRVPAWMVIGLAGGATGLLAPILMGLPLGLVLQLVVEGNARTAGMDNLSPWVFALVYGGFALLALAICALLWEYVVRRWGELLARSPRPPASWVVALAGFAMVPFGAAMLWWGMAGPGAHGPQGMDAISQRTVLVITGLLVLAGFVTPLLAERLTSRLAWLLTWTGCAVAALQAPTQALLANGGNPTVAIAAMGLISLPGACLYGFAVLHRRVVRFPLVHGAGPRWNGGHDHPTSQRGTS